MRVLFVVPRSANPKQTYREYPLGVGFLGTLLKAQGHEVRIWDEQVEAAEQADLPELVRAFQPGLVGFSVLTPNYPIARAQIRGLRAEHPESKIAAGGVHASLFPEDLIADGADVVVLGEGEHVISQLVRRLEEGQDLVGLPGTVCRDSQGQVVRSAGDGSGGALADVPVVDRSLYHLPRYTHHSVLASRGCPYSCRFCCNYTGTVSGRGTVVRRPEDVIAELEYLRDTFGAAEVFFADDIFLLRKREILEFCRQFVSRCVGIRWVGQMRADRVDAEVAEAMAAAGCHRVYFGVESGSEKLLQRARKGMGLGEIRRGIKAAKAAGLRVKTGWIYGLPGSLDEQYESIAFMLELRPHEISIHQLIPFPGTVYYDKPDRYGIRIADPKAFQTFCYGGLDGGIRFDHLSHQQLVRLLEDTSTALEAQGYVSSDRAGQRAEYLYTTPLCRNSMNVFRPATAALVE